MSRSAIDQASDVGGVVSAARMREGFMRRRANASSEEKRGEYDDAIGTLEDRFPELEGLPAGGAEKFARERGHGTGKRSPTHEGRRRPRKPDAAPLEHAAEKAGSPAPAKSSSPAGRDKPSGGSARGGPQTRQAPGRSRRNTSPGRTERRVRSRGARAYRETGIPAAGASASSIAMSVLGGTVGLAAVYLLLSSAERGGAGGKAIPTLLDSAGGFLRRVIAPEDFFGPAITPKEFAAAENPKGIATKKLANPAVGVNPGRHLLPRQLGFKK